LQFNRRMDNWIHSDKAKEDPDAKAREELAEAKEKDDVRLEKRKRDDVSQFAPFAHHGLTPYTTVTFET
jgi:hypothetical protein